MAELNLKNRIHVFSSSDAKSVLKFLKDGTLLEQTFFESIFNKKGELKTVLPQSDTGYDVNDITSGNIFYKAKNTSDNSTQIEHISSHGKLQDIVLRYTENFLALDEGNIAIFTNYIISSEVEKIKRQANSKYLFSNSVNYSYCYVSNKDKFSEIETALNESFCFPFTTSFLLNFNDLNSFKQIFDNKKFLINFVLPVVEAMVVFGAYDDESFLLWEKQSILKLR